MHRKEGLDKTSLNNIIHLEKSNLKEICQKFSVASEKLGLRVKWSKSETNSTLPALHNHRRHNMRQSVNNKTFPISVTLPPHKEITKTKEDLK